MKTAIQEMVDIVEMDYNNGVEISMKVFHGMLLKALFKEKQQVLDAYNQGYRDGENAEESTKALVDVSQWADAENYYKNAFQKRSIPVNLDFKDTLCEGCGNYNMQCTCYEKSKDDHFNGLR